MDDTDDLCKEESEVSSGTPTFPFRKRKRSSCLVNDSVSVVSANVSVASEPKAKKSKRYSLAAIFATPIKPILKLGASRQSSFSKCDNFEEPSMLPPSKSLIRRSCSIRSNPTVMGPPPTPSPKTIKSANAKIQQPTDKDTKHRLTRNWSQSFGNLNKSLQNMEIKRQEAIYELYCSEFSMVKDLQLIKKTYRDSLVHLKILTEQEAQCIFESLDELLNLHTELRDKLDELKTSTGVVEAVGKVIVAWVPGIKCYSLYCMNHFRAKQLLEEKMRNSFPLRDFLQRCLDSPFSRKLDLLSFLDVPRSRLVKYPLMIEGIIRYTDPYHHDYKVLEKTLPMLKSLLQNVDQVLGMAECTEFLSHLVWPSHLKPDDMESASAVLCSGELKDRKGNKVYCFLFDIGFLLTRHIKGKYNITHQLIKGSELQVDEIQPLRASRNSSRMFRVSSVDASTFVFEADTDYSKSHWVNKIKVVIASCQCGQKSQVTQRPLAPTPLPPTKDIETLTVV